MARRIFGFRVRAEMMATFRAASCLVMSASIVLYLAPWLVAKGCI